MRHVAPSFSFNHVFLVDRHRLRRRAPVNLVPTSVLESAPLVSGQTTLVELASLLPVFIIGLYPVYCLSRPEMVTADVYYVPTL